MRKNVFFRKRAAPTRARTSETTKRAIILDRFAMKTCSVRTRLRSFAASDFRLTDAHLRRDASVLVFLEIANVREFNVHTVVAGFLANLGINKYHAENGKNWRARSISHFGVGQWPKSKACARASSLTRRSENDAISCVFLLFGEILRKHMRLRSSRVCCCDDDDLLADDAWFAFGGKQRSDHMQNATQIACGHCYMCEKLV